MCSKDIIGAVTQILFEIESDESTLIFSQCVNAVTTEISIIQQCEIYEEPPLKKKKFEQYVKIPHQFPDTSFAEHFRMSRTTFEVLLGKMKSEDEHIQKFYTPYDTQLLIVLWVLATPDSFRSVGERFKIKKGVVHFIYVQYIRKLSKIASAFIKWPSRHAIQETQQSIQRKRGFPGVVGFIDGTYINIRAPLESTRYYNRKKQASLILQAVCNDRLLLMDIYFGEVGSLHDNRVFSRSPLNICLQREPVQFLGNNGHLLGDCAYKLSKIMLTPFRDNGHLLDEQVHYNKTHSSIRMNIERAFGLLKGKWRSLKYIDSNNLEYIRDHVITCCVLHNFLLLEKDCAVVVNETVEEEDHVPVLGEEPAHNDDQPEGSQKRNNIAAMLYEQTYCQ